MGLFDNVAKQLLAQIQARADQMGIELRDAAVTLQGNTPVISGEVDSEADRLKLASFIRAASAQANVNIIERITISDEEDEDDEDEDDDDEDYDDEDEDEDDEDEDEDDEDEEEEEDQEYTVQRGDSFWKIAEEFYGDGAKHKIISEYNNTNSIHPGDVIVIPSLRSYIGGEKLQVMLSVCGYKVGSIDGVVGPKTTNALRDFQRDYDLKTSGRVDDETKDALRAAFYDASEMDGRSLQIILRDLGYTVGSIDGIVGPKTKEALREFQDDNDLDVTGRLDEDTISALVESYA